MSYFCVVKQENIVNGFTQLGKLMRALGASDSWSDFSIGLTQEEYTDLETLIKEQHHGNGWFTEDNVRKSLSAIGDQLTASNLEQWLEGHTYTTSPKKVGVIMAGNIPLVGFHDFLCVLASGNNALCKLSSTDKTLLPAMAKHLIQFVPELSDRIEFTDSRMVGMEAIIATGSDNSHKYFEQYFGKYPHVFRKNRTSIAILDGSESKEELKSLGSDIFSYFGLGCRNVSHLILPKGYDLDQFFGAIVDYSGIINNNKYANNYDYNKAVYLMNLHDLLDNNFALLRESDELFSPLSMIHYHYYDAPEDVAGYLAKHEGDLQAIVGKAYLPFGAAQCPQLGDYADGVDVLEWLSNL
ncbi:MAG: hypothetical protein ACI865_000949 [Flavobacteriaceae bacterium]|jgi:hypothetical protein